MEDPQPHNLYKGLGIAKCIKADSPNTPDSQSKYFGLPVRGLRTVNRYHDILPEIFLKAYSTSTRTMS